MKRDFTYQILLRKIKMAVAFDPAVKERRAADDVEVLPIEDESLLLTMPDRSALESLPEAQGQGQGLFSARYIQRQGRVRLKLIAIEVGAKGQNPGHGDNKEQESRGLRGRRDSDHHSSDRQGPAHRRDLIFFQAR